MNWLSEGICEEIQTTIHLARRWREQGEERVGGAVWSLWYLTGEADLCPRQEWGGPIDLQQPISTREACRWDLETTEEYLRPYCCPITCCRSCSGPVLYLKHQWTYLYVARHYAIVFSIEHSLWYLKRLNMMLILSTITDSKCSLIKLYQLFK